MLDTTMTKEERIENNERLRKVIKQLNLEGHTLRYFSKIVGYSYGGFRNFVCGASNMHPANLYILRQHLKDRFGITVEFTNDDKRNALLAQIESKYNE